MYDSHGDDISGAYVIGGRRTKLNKTCQRIPQEESLSVSKSYVIMLRSLLNRLPPTHRLTREWVLERAHKIGSLETAPAAMSHEAYPKPARIIFPNGIVMWRTDSLENLPRDAKDYRLNKSSISFAATCKYQSCDVDIRIDSLSDFLIKCPSCREKKARCPWRTPPLFCFGLVGLVTKL